MKKQSQAGTNARLQLYQDLSEGKLSLSEAVRKMRKVVGLTQVQYAELIGIAPRVLIDLERGVGNPTLKTLEKIGKPFGLVLTFRKESEISR